MNTINDFEDENPFEQDGARISLETSSTSQDALYEPSSPSGPNSALSPAQNSNKPPFPSPGSHRLPQANYKTDFCCSSDRFLHSGDDIEILVRLWIALLFRVNPFVRFWMHKRRRWTRARHILHTSFGQVYVHVRRLNSSATNNSSCFCPL